MSHPRIVTENFLDNWVRENARDAQGVTVELIWRLVAASCPSPQHRRFPLSDSIGQHGSDGELETIVGSPPFVPDGRSFWEIGTNLDAREKANSDYRDLVATIPKDVRELSTFVFVTPLSGRRDWQNTWKEDGIASWVEERQKRRDWADISVLNGASLIDWLYRFPAVERWLAGAFGQKIDFIETVDARWDTLRMIGSPPPLSHDIFLESRPGAAQKAREIIVDKTGSQLKLDTRFPAQGPDFIAALVGSLSENQRVDAIGRCLIVTHEDAWSGVCSLGDSHVLVADFDLETERGARLVQAALNRRHAVIFTGLPGGIPHANRVSLPTPDEDQMKSALEKSGYLPERARKLANACRGDLNALVRCIQGLSSLPEWTQRTDASEIAVAMLLGAWSEKMNGDRVVLEGVMGKAYGESIAKIREFANLTAAPLQFRDGFWQISSRYESWQLLGRWLSDDDLDRFRASAVSALRVKDRRFALPAEQRFLAGAVGDVDPHSSGLRKGLAESLALLGTLPTALSSCSDGAAETTAILAVREILKNADWELWASLNDVLPLLAEAAPMEFLGAVETAIHSADGPFPAVFNQERPGICGGTYITGLLWGLESLAWSSDHIVSVCRLLADLAAQDPGGSWTNRPKNSLTAILLPWFPQTCASTKKRHAAARVVGKEHPDVGWNLALSLLPELHSMTFGTHKPIWRPYIPEDWKDGAPDEQWSEDLLVYATVALELAGDKPKRLAKLVDRYFRLPVGVQTALRQKLLSPEIFALDATERFGLWSTLTKLISNHRKFADSEYWRVPEGSLTVLDALVDQIKPMAPKLRHKALFDGVDADLFNRLGDYEAQRAELQARRQSAVRDLLSTGGLSLVIELASDIDASWKVGVALGTLGEQSFESGILPSLLEAESKSLHQFAGGFIWGCHRLGGWDWVDSLDVSGWSIEARAQLFSFLPFCDKTWSRVAAHLRDAEGSYWRRVSANPYECPADIEGGVEKLITFDRADSAVQCLQPLIERKEFNAALALRVLASLSNRHAIDPHGIGQLISRLQTDGSVNEEDLRLVERKFLGLLGRDHFAQPVTLWRWLAENPDFFCELIQFVYGSDDNPEGAGVVPAEEHVARVRSVYNLLDEWRVAPGVRRDGTFDGDALVLWINEVKAKSIRFGRWGVAAIKIGEVLFHAPRDPSGLWIGSVCEVLDAPEYSEIRRGLSMEIFNSRGVFTFTSGEDERKHADHWTQMASLADDLGFSRLGEELRALALAYRRDAERESKGSSFSMR